MGMVGAFGDTVFTVSSNKILTFNDFQRESSGRWADHERHLMKPLTEFIGPGLDKISFNIILAAVYGVDPRAELNKLLEYERSGLAATLVIGSKAVGVYKWTLRSLSQNWKYFDGYGNLLFATAGLSLVEYAEV